MDSRLLDDPKQWNRTYLIYRCVAKRSDDTAIERVLKIQAFYTIEDLAIALITMGYAPGCIKSFRVSAEDYDREYDEDQNRILDGLGFFDLGTNRNITVSVNYEDGQSIHYSCEYVGMDIVEKKITRKTPICICAKGYSILTHKEHFNMILTDDKFYRLTYDNYYNMEEWHVAQAINDLRGSFTFYQSLYYKWFMMEEM